MQATTINRSANRAQGVRSMVYGGILLGIGIAATMGSQAMAAPGGTYTVFVGLIAVGVVRVLYGFFQAVIGFGKQ